MERREALKDKKPKRRGPPSLAGHMSMMRETMERIDAAFESAGDDALEYLPRDDRREFERTITRMSEFVEAWAARLSAPVGVLEVQESDVTMDRTVRPAPIRQPRPDIW